MKGKSKSLLGKRGRVESVNTSGKSAKHRVIWSDGTSGDYFTRALDPIDGSGVNIGPPPTPNVENLSPLTRGGFSRDHGVR